jgi:hypothetical protein
VNFVVVPIQVPELRQAMSDGMEALRSGEMTANLMRNTLAVKEVYESVPEDIVDAHKHHPQDAAGSSFSFGLHTGMELMRRIARYEPERLLAADLPAAISRLVARNGDGHVEVPGFGRVSLEVSLAAISAVGDDIKGPAPTEVVLDEAADIWKDPQGSGYKGD